jgi:hypothetical protein
MDVIAIRLLPIFDQEQGAIKNNAMNGLLLLLLSSPASHSAAPDCLFAWITPIQL